MILGKNLVLAINGTPLAAARSCSIDKQQSFLPVASPTSGRYEQSLPERLAWSISADALVGTMDAYKTLDAAMDDGTLLTIRYYDTEYNLNKTGTAYIENLHLEGSVGSLAKMSVTLKGSGPTSTYQGVAITMQLVGSHDGERVDVNNESATFVDDGDSTNCLRYFTLANRGLVRIVPNGEVVIMTTESMIEQFYGDSHDFLLSALHATNYTQTTEVWLNAGTYYVITSNLDDVQDVAEFFLKS